MERLRQLFEASPRSAFAKTLWQPQPRCAFLDLLPGEIRNAIYSLVLRESQTHPFSNQHIDLFCLLQPRLTATCRQIQHESLSIFFAEDCFKLTIRVTPKWHLIPLIDECTKRWIKAAGYDARGLQEVNFFVDRPDRNRYRAVQLLPWDTWHFNTSWSLSVRDDNSDWPHCLYYLIALRWRKLVNSDQKKFSLTFDDVVDIGEEIAMWWVPAPSRFWRRRLGQSNINRIRRFLLKIWPNMYVSQKGKRECACYVCRVKRREAAKAEKKRANT